MSTAGAKVIVASKLPHALLLHVDEPHENLVNTPSGSRTVVEYRKGHVQVRINGNAYPVGIPPEGFREKPDMSGGYALTYDVDKDFWDAWMGQHKTDPMVVNKLIFACEKIDTTRGKTKEWASLRTGFEPIDPNGDPRSPRKIPGSGVSTVAPAEGPPPAA